MNPERREEPEGQTDIDRRFAEIVGHLDPTFTMDAKPAPPDPSTTHEDTADDAERTPDEDDEGPGESAPLADLPTQWRMPPSGSASMLDGDEAEDFVPAPPQPLPSGDDLGFWTMAGCLVGGPAWLLYLFFFDRYAQSLWWVLACTLFVAGVIQLFMRSPKSRDDEDDDDGAVL